MVKFGREGHFFMKERRKSGQKIYENIVQSDTFWILWSELKAIWSIKGVWNLE